MNEQRQPNDDEHHADDQFPHVGNGLTQDDKLKKRDYRDDRQQVTDASQQGAGEM